MSASRDPSPQPSPSRGEGAETLLARGEKRAELERAERDCRLRAGVLAMEPELPDDVARRIQIETRRIVRDWLREVNYSSELAPAHVLSAYFALVKAVERHACLVAEARRDAATPAPA